METTRKLKSLKDITVDERVKFINSLKNKVPKDVLAAAEKLDMERKEGKKTRDKGIKNVANELSKLTTVERDNRKKLMNRLQTNGAEKVLANAKKLNQERKNKQKEIRNGVEFKLKNIGLNGSNIITFMKRWDDTKNETIFDDARKKVMEKKPLLNKVTREITGTLGIWRERLGRCNS